MVQVNIMNPESSDLLNGRPLDRSLQLLCLCCCEARVTDQSEEIHLIGTKVTNWFMQWWRKMKGSSGGLMEVSLLTWHPQMVRRVHNIVWQNILAGLKSRGRIKVSPSEPKIGLLSQRYANLRSLAEPVAYIFGCNLEVRPSSNKRVAFLHNSPFLYISP